MRKIRITIIPLLISLIILAIPVTFSGCSPSAQADSDLRVSGPWDLYHISIAINDNTAKDARIPPIQMTPSINEINELKKGEYDAVLLGRDPTPEELQGLKDYVIAYDAVCIIIDENSYKGGKYSAFGNQPLRKDGGLRDLTTEELKSIFTTDPGQSWRWNGDYYVANPGLDPGSWLAAVDTVYWVKTPALVNCKFFFPPGKYDTQTVLYRNLGLDEKAILSKRQSFLDPALNQEEEILSLEYKDSTLFATKFGPQDYTFKLGFASRRVMTIAPVHVPVRVVSVDGINPMTTPQSIYDGTYKFSRKIHLLIRENDPAATNLADFLLTADGQKIIGDAGYLPVIPLPVK